MNAYLHCVERLKSSPKKWLVTGAAGFIGSNLVEALLLLDQQVVGVDNFATGHNRNLEQVRSTVSNSQWARFQFTRGDIRDLQACRQACAGVHLVLHQAALGSVPRSIKDPLSTHEVNITGFLNMLIAANEAGISRFVYASSSSVYGDLDTPLKTEDVVGKPLSPYAASKAADELYAHAFARCHGIECVGLRYFNVFGRRQDPDGPYAAVIPKWIAGIIRGEPVYINGDGETSRDFCYIDNVIQANLLSACATMKGGSEVFNVAGGERTSLNELFRALVSHLARRFPHAGNCRATYRDFRPGDVRHSLADIAKAKATLGYSPTHRFDDGLVEAMKWYVAHLDIANSPGPT
jgi:UDP-N-acetylglucosamine/UDP-N-acetylgalactosamine 4-epimerase